jgi:hypothetical protein
MQNKQRRHGVTDLGNALGGSYLLTGQDFFYIYIEKIIYAPYGTIQGLMPLLVPMFASARVTRGHGGGTCSKIRVARRRLVLTAPHRGDFSEPRVT